MLSFRSRGLLLSIADKFLILFKRTAHKKTWTSEATAPLKSVVSEMSQYIENSLQLIVTRISKFNVAKLTNLEYQKNVLIRNYASTTMNSFTCSSSQNIFEKYNKILDEAGSRANSSDHSRAISTVSNNVFDNMSFGDLPLTVRHRPPHPHWKSLFQTDLFIKNVFSKNRAYKLINKNEQDHAFKEASSEQKITLGLTFAEAALGAEKTIVISHPVICTACNGTTLSCSRCSGTGKIKQKLEVSLSVPSCVSDGDIMKIPVGNSTYWILFKVDPSPDFKRIKEDIHSQAEISFTQAVLGGYVKVKGLEGEHCIRIEPGTQCNSRLILRGVGARKADGYGRGNHVLNLQIRVPRRLSEQQKDALLSFARLEGRVPGTVKGIKYNKDGTVRRSAPLKFRELADATIWDLSKRVMLWIKRIIKDARRQLL